jgi:large subunit ribosomal protein L11
MNTEKVLKGTAKMVCYAGNAKPNPKLGQALGPLGLNMMQFCKEFNERTNELRNDVPMRVVLKAYLDRSFNFIVKPPPTSWYIKRCVGLEQLSSFPRRKIVGELGIKYVYEIAKIKQKIDPDFRNHNIYGLCKMIIAQAECMGITVVKDTLSPGLIIPKKV